MIVLVTADPSGAEGRAIETAAADTLGADATVVVRHVERAPEDRDALALAASLRADVVAEVVWLEPEHLHATVHVLFAGDLHWVERELGFSALDAETEKGRTIGFALASMLPSRRAVSISPPEPRADVRPADGESAPVPRVAPHVWTGSIDASAVGAAAIGGAGSGLGGAVAGQWYFARHFALRAEATLRAGETEPAGATASFFGAGVGTAWRLLDPTRARPFGVGARADFLVVRQALIHLVAANADRESRSRWLPGADLLVEGSWAFAEGAAILGAFGAEARFGATEVFLRNAQVATLVPVSLLFETGVRARF